MSRPLRVLIAAALTVATFAGASAANASTAPGTPATLSHAAAEARTNASSALGGIVLPVTSTSRLRAASASAAHGVQSIDETLRVNVKDRKYDVHVVSVGTTADPTRIQLFLGSAGVRVSVRSLVRITVIRHGYKHSLLEVTTTFRRFVVMIPGLVGNPLTGTRAHFATRSDLVAAFGHGLALTGPQVIHEYGAILRFAQMALDLSATLLQAAEYAVQHPTATAFGTVATVQTTRGSGGYTGAVTLTGTPAAFTVTATNTTDGSSLTESFSAQSFTITYTVGGRTFTRTV